MSNLPEKKLNPSLYRSDFPFFQNTDTAYLDNAATTQKPQVVLDIMQRLYTHYNANVHRGLYAAAEQATQAYETARDHVQQFIHAAHREEIIFTSGTTASINLVAFTLGELLIEPGDSILLSPGEHHSNLVPWQLLAERKRAHLKWFRLLPDGSIDQTQIEGAFDDTIKFVAIGHISNASGIVNPVERIIAQAHARGIPVLVDAAQSVPHQPIDVQVLDCDFLAFSGHKMCGPTGTGVLYGKRAWLDKLPPWQAGGDMISTVDITGSTWADLPHKFEAGTPNIAGVIGLDAALAYLSAIGMDTVQRVTRQVYEYLCENLLQCPGVRIMGPSDSIQRSSIVSFTVAGVHPHDLAQIADQHGVAIRAGHHCAQPLMQHWQVPATARASVYFYNTPAEVDRLIEAIKAAQQTLART